MYRQRCGGSSPFDGTIDSSFAPSGLILFFGWITHGLRPFDFVEHCSLSPLRGWSFGGDRLDPSLLFQVSCAAEGQPRGLSLREFLENEKGDLWFEIAFLQ